MNICNPRRILLVSAPDSSTLDLLKNLTGTAPEPQCDSIAGLSHFWAIETAYYTASVPIWIDEIVDAEAWKNEFLKPEAKEVLEVVGAVVLCFKRAVDEEDLGRIKSTLEAVSTVVRKGCRYGWDGVCLAVSMPQSVTPHLPLEFEEAEELCREAGFEYIEGDAKGRNEFGEPVGIARIKEALQANDWDGGEGEEFLSESLDLGSDDEDEDGGIVPKAEVAQIEREMFGMRDAIYGQRPGQSREDDGQDEELKVEELERLMVKVQVVKDMGADMPETERKKFAAKAINDIMKTL
ncbi:hypothetical protein MMC16_002701 [Acarospora aff. strigata]|nr:hypothetical protein [Acarospora aff. strigata]